MESRVVPGSSKAITRSSPNNALTKVDLPTFGRPTMAIFGFLRLVRSSSKLCSGKFSKASSTKSLTPSPCADEIDNGSPKPNSWKSAETTALFIPSVLFTASKTGRCDLRNLSAIINSCGVMPARPSTKKITTSASSMASKV